MFDRESSKRPWTRHGQAGTPDPQEVIDLLSAGGCSPTNCIRTSQANANGVPEYLVFGFPLLNCCNGVDLACDCQIGGQIVLTNVSSTVWQSDPIACGDGMTTTRWILTAGAAGFSAGSTLSIALPTGGTLTYKLFAPFCAMCANEFTISCQSARDVKDKIILCHDSQNQPNVPAEICVAPSAYDPRVFGTAADCTAACPSGFPAEWLIVPSATVSGDACCPQYIPCVAEPIDNTVDWIPIYEEAPVAGQCAWIWSTYPACASGMGHVFFAIKIDNNKTMHLVVCHTDSIAAYSIPAVNCDGDNVFSGITIPGCTGTITVTVSPA